MNPKIEKLANEIEKTQSKIADLEEKLDSMKKQKTELENTEYVAIIRSLNLSPKELAAFIKERQEGTAPHIGARYTLPEQEEIGHED